MASTGSLHINKACSPQVFVQGHQLPQLTSITTQIYQTNMDPHQISPPDVIPKPIISSRHRSSPIWCCNKSQPIWALTKYLQQTSGLPQYPSGLEHLHCQTTRILPTFSTDASATQIISNWRRGSLKYFQPSSGISKPAPFLLWGCLKYLLLAFIQHAHQEHLPFVTSNIYCLPLYGRMTCAPFLR